MVLIIVKLEEGLPPAFLLSHMPLCYQDEKVVKMVFVSYQFTQGKALYGNKPSCENMFSIARYF